MLISHRGANLLAPENTLAAFELAYQMGAAWVECDVVLTEDSVPVILHDRDLWRTARVHANIDNLSYDALQNYNVGAYFAKNKIQVTAPKLEALLELALQYGRGVNIEIKPALSAYAEATAECAWEIMGPYLNRIPILVSSFELEALLWYKQNVPGIQLGYLMSSWQTDWKEKAMHLKVISIHCDEKILNPKRLSILTGSQYSILAYTVNNVTRAEELFANGVVGIFSDDPLLLSR
jgi:glycerophosphoryl diester phosphodiesterase